MAYSGHLNHPSTFVKWDCCWSVVDWAITDRLVWRKESYFDHLAAVGGLGHIAFETTGFASLDASIFIVRQPVFDGAQVEVHWRLCGFDDYLRRDVARGLAALASPTSLARGDRPQTDRRFSVRSVTKM